MCYIQFFIRHIEIMLCASQWIQKDTISKSDRMIAHMNEHINSAHILWLRLKRSKFFVCFLLRFFSHNQIVPNAHCTLHTASRKHQIADTY